jgi:hypothetical protein
MILAVLSASSKGAEARHASRNPMVRVVTISQAELRHGNDDLLEDTISRLNQAANSGPISLVFLKYLLAGLQSLFRDPLPTALHDGRSSIRPTCCSGSRPPATAQSTILQF